MDSYKALRDKVYQLVSQLPLNSVYNLGDVFQSSSQRDWPIFQSSVLRQIPQSDKRELVKQFLQFWEIQYPKVTPYLVSSLMIATAETIERHRKQERVELVWTGYNRHQKALRNLQEALIELIDSADTELHIVSFAIYRFEPVVSAFKRAIARGVDIYMYLEMLNDTDIDTAFSQIESFDARLANSVTLYVWAEDMRPLNSKEKSGSMHAKLAIADGHSLLISSANLTEYALTINLEAGVLIKGGEKPEIVRQELQNLKDNGSLVKSG